MFYSTLSPVYVCPIPRLSEPHNEPGSEKVLVILHDSLMTAIFHDAVSSRLRARPSLRGGMATCKTNKQASLKKYPIHFINSILMHTRNLFNNYNIPLGLIHFAIHFARLLLYNHLFMFNFFVLSRCFLYRHQFSASFSSAAALLSRLQGLRLSVRLFKRL